MILDSCANFEKYAPHIPHLPEALACLAAHRDAAAPARFDFPGGYVLLQEGTTRPPEGDLEAHRAYLDVQVLMGGRETVFWADTAELTVTEAYDEAKDAAMYAGPASAVEVRAGMFYVCWPHDAHKPCRSAGEPSAYRKAVIKLAVD